MLVYVDRTHIEKDPKNQVTSHLIYEPHRRQNSDNLKFDENGIFSKKIFGNFHKCSCGKLKEEGFCDKCNTRVIDIKNMPDFYIDLRIAVSASFADYDSAIASISQFKGILEPTEEDLIDIMNYNKFVYEDNIYNFDENDINLTSKFDESKVLIGVDALKALGISDTWIKKNTVDYLSIPHTMYRPIILDNKNSKPFITGLNLLYSDIIKKINDILELDEFAKGNPFYLMVEYRAIVKIYKEIMEKLMDELVNNKYSILKSEIISHPISGAIRGVLTNRHDVHEDVLIVGDTFVETLWPYLYKKHDGNMALINEELIEGGYLVLINRPPTISRFSVMAMKPRIASIYQYGKIDKTNGALKHNYEYVLQNERSIGTFFDRDGDVEKYLNDINDGIDTIGLRTVGMNPIVFDGLAADTDGDVLFVIALYSKHAIAEAESMLPSKCYIEYPNGTIRNHIIEDFLLTDE